MRYHVPKMPITIKLQYQVYWFKLYKNKYYQEICTQNVYFESHYYKTQMAKKGMNVIIVQNVFPDFVNRR